MKLLVLTGIVQIMDDDLLLEKISELKQQIWALDAHIDYLMETNASLLDIVDKQDAKDRLITKLDRLMGFV